MRQFPGDLTPTLPKEAEHKSLITIPAKTRPTSGLLNQNAQLLDQNMVVEIEGSDSEESSDGNAKTGGAVQLLR